MKIRFIIVCIFIPVFICFGSDFKKTLSSIELKDGDTFVFIGNSITHQCLYTQYVEDYFYTRYPFAHIRFHNAGVSGDVAKDVLYRLEDDIAQFQPTYASILIGMNDGRYTDFEHKIFSTYKKDMTVLLDKLEERKIIPILITPTMFDLRPALSGDNWLDPEVVNNIHYNATLAFFGAWLFQMANERGFGYVNMYEPLNRITRENRKENPDFTMIDDAVHPEADGQLVMALSLLRDIEANPVVSTIHLDHRNDTWQIIQTVNGKLEKLDGDQIRFNFTSGSLPWVVPEEAALGFKLSGAGNVMSREIVRITGLDPGDYILQIDGKIIGKYSHLQFSEGIALQENKLTPQYQQAATIARLNKKRNEEAISPLRDLWLARKHLRFLIEEPERFDKEEREELMKKSGLEDRDQFLKEFPEKVEQFLQKAKELENQIYKINKPASHNYEITRNN